MAQPRQAHHPWADGGHGLTPAPESTSLSLSRASRRCTDAACAAINPPVAAALSLDLWRPRRYARVAETEQFGASDVTHLTWKNLLDGYSCTECGRCTAACPANITGKVLSPRKIVVNTRQRLMELAPAAVSDGARWIQDFVDDHCRRGGRAVVLEPSDKGDMIVIRHGRRALEGLLRADMEAALGALQGG